MGWEVCQRNRSYFFPDCRKGYDVEDAAHHSCMGRNCTSCQGTRSQKDKGGCPDFKPGKKRTIHSKDCQRDFYGPDCYKDHKIKKGKKKVSLWQRYRKCLKCCKHYKVNPKQAHKCYHDTCRHCKDVVHIYDHKCYIQPAEKEMPQDESSEHADGDNEMRRNYHLSLLLEIYILNKMMKAGKFSLQIWFDMLLRRIHRMYHMPLVAIDALNSSFTPWVI